MAKRVRKVPLLATRCVCPIDYGPCKRDKLASDKASKRKDSCFVIHTLCVCVCVCPIDYGPCRRNELASVIKDTGGARRVKQYQCCIENIDAFQGPPKALDKPITAGEVKKSLDRLKNNRASGQDGISAELLKYGTKALDEQLAIIFNDTFENHQDPNINVGELIAIPKPGKPKGPPKNLRPITLLNTIRKALSIITLHRIRLQVEKYLSPSQSGFRTDRSTADVVWTHKWLAAKTNAENVEIKITGIDMSAAFDTIDRKALLDILKTIIDEDEVRIIRFLLSNTVVNTKVNKATEEKPFISNVGTPQGDSLSPVLFIIYLEHDLRDIPTNISPPTDIERLLPREVAYTDDVDFVSPEFIKVEEVQKALERHRLFVNMDKTDFTTLSRNAKDWRET
ncbi:retrovirus-related Pol polyprotein LINE-1 [Elysia marginata]|uniref:Retrovirus-related Pol polyprotein LINE-1 n=1 Tax=Elysia marginata TaxID=1093978 RepID=A0AAV4FTP3_9GAST|nr:retrovirus-related Pol polyprotein LINE-1 [Elysia marginata]